MKFDKEEFGAWRDTLITEEVFRALALLAEKSKQRWLEHSWDGGSADPLMLADLRARAEVARDLCELTYEEIEEYLDDKSERH